MQTPSLIEVGHGCALGDGARAAGREAALAATAAVRARPLSLVLVFASARHDPSEVLAGVREITGDAPLVGTSTAGEIDGGELHGSVVVAAVASPELAVHVGAAGGVAGGWRAALDAALGAQGVAPYFEGPRRWLQATRAGRGVFALLFTPGDTRSAPSSSHDVLAALSARAGGRLAIFGGSAGDDGRMEENWVLAGDRAIPDGLAVAVVETSLQFGIAAAHGFQLADERVVVTAASGHEALALDGRPAAQRYAELSGASRAELQGRPLPPSAGILLAAPEPLGEPLPLLATNFTPGGGVHFARALAEGTALHRLRIEREPVRGAAMAALGKAVLRGGIGDPALVLTAYCALRPPLLGTAARAELDPVTRALSGTPLVGFQSLGEQGLTDAGACFHANGVVSVLALGGDISREARVAREAEALRREAEERGRELEELRRREQEQLEDLVRERTAMLERLAAELRSRLEQLRRTEESLRQAQKMEAVGRLAGGVAHDFNNMLTVILGSAKELRRRPGADEEARGLADEVLEAGQRAAALTRQLLAFGRQQALRPQELDLNEVVRGLERMLRRLIGEDVEVVMRLDEGLGLVRADPGQLEQVVVNLALNARDAMPGGGRLTLSTRAAEHGAEGSGGGPALGPYAVLAVADTGRGMEPEVLEHVFEPFFTTKGRARGTGLGLATAFGIVKQSGGDITVHSEPGVGTTFEVYLPHPGNGPAAAPTPRDETEAPHGEDAVLLVEDDAAVRALMRRSLEAAGYRVLEAGLPDDALRVASTPQAAIDLLLTDVVMPGMSGPDLAVALLSLRPGLRVLFVSGYTEDAALRSGALPSGQAFLQKPFTGDELVRAVRDALRMAPPQG